ncbi:MAG: hypothetical protein EBT47_13545 [Chloroflexi bacterium]|nr:hypothetical protein [Chloroflexota bacterium]
MMPMTTEDQTPGRVNSQVSEPQAGWSGDGSPHRAAPMTVQPHPRLLHEVIDSAFSHGHGFFIWLARRLRGDPEPNRLGVHRPEIGISLEGLDDLGELPDDAPGTGPG